jgi:hypothetical protein
MLVLQHRWLQAWKRKFELGPHTWVLQGPHMWSACWCKLVQSMWLALSMWLLEQHMSRWWLEQAQHKLVLPCMMLLVPLRSWWFRQVQHTWWLAS